jgi:hypothetical protein
MEQRVIPFNFTSQWDISLRRSSSNGRTSNNPAQATLTLIQTEPSGTTTFTFTATDNTGVDASPAMTRFQSGT